MGLGVGPGMMMEGKLVVVSVCLTDGVEAVLARLLKLEVKGLGVGVMKELSDPVLSPFIFAKVA